MKLVVSIQPSKTIRGYSTTDELKKYDNFT